MRASPLAVVMLIVCTANPSPAAPKPRAAQVAYFYGDVVTTSPDGKIPYGPPKKSLVKRTSSPADGLMIEDVRQGPETYLTTLRRVGQTLRFSAADAGKTFGGELVFDTEPWGNSSWTYAITMADRSGKLIGTGRLSDTGIATRKQFVAADGSPKVLIVEELKSISAEEYTRLAAMPPGGSPGTP